MLLCFGALAETAPDLTDQCTFKSPGSNATAKVHDGQYTSYWSGKEGKNNYLEFTMPEDRPAGWIYICFGITPDAWAIENDNGGVWETVYEGDAESYAHIPVELGGLTHFRLIDTTGRKTKFKINEISIFGEGDLPDWVQQWEPAAEKADLMLIAAHPDDELIFFGGTIPTYAVERGKNVVVVYMSSSNSTRRSELLNGLWSMGVRNYPVIGDFKDTYSSKVDDAYRKWGRDEVLSFITTQIRRYRPEVLLTHDVDGEYGHGAHKLCADAAQYCVAHAAERSFQPDSYKEYGVWQVRKLYLHLYPENEVVMDWNVPLSALGGDTGLEAAANAYKLHVTQQTTKFVVTDQGETSCARFGLAFTAVGEDVAKNDFLEHTGDDIPQEILTQEAEEAKAAADEAAAKEAKDAEQAAKKAAGGPYGKAQANVEWPVEKPALDEYGYPLEGEVVLEDDENGVWFYASPTLVVRIDRIFNEKEIRTWYEAQIFCDMDKERFGSYLYDPENPTKKHVQAELISHRDQVVFAMNTDYYTYRLGRKTKVGMIIRDGKVLYDRVPEADRAQFPNLDTLAMYEDGSWAVYKSDELTAEQYLSDGAVDVFAFGPYLLRDGEINPFIAKMRNGKTDQPRCALGMIEPGHYFAILAEGRMQKISIGVSISWLAEHMQAAGCVNALNFDGGQTALMTFMGKRITRIGRYAGGRTTPRETTEIMGIGHSDQIEPEWKK